MYPRSAARSNDVFERHAGRYLRAPPRVESVRTCCCTRPGDPHHRRGRRPRRCSSRSRPPITPAPRANLLWFDLWTSIAVVRRRRALRPFGRSRRCGRDPARRSTCRPRRGRSSPRLSSRWVSTTGHHIPHRDQARPQYAQSSDEREARAGHCRWPGRCGAPRYRCCSGRSGRFPPLPCRDAGRASCWPARTPEQPRSGAAPRVGDRRCFPRTCRTRSASSATALERNRHVAEGSRASSFSARFAAATKRSLRGCSRARVGHASGLVQQTHREVALGAQCQQRLQVSPRPRPSG